MKKILLIGGGGHCRACIDVIETTKNWKIVGILDLAENVGKKVFSYDILGTDDDLKKYLSQFDEVLITIGQIKNPKLRSDLFLKLQQAKVKFATIISPHAYVSSYASIGEGSIIMHQAFVGPNAKIGRNCIINNKAQIEHDAVIEDFCHISTAAVVNGECKVLDSTFIGSNAVLKEGIVVNKNSIIAAGSFFKGQ